MFLTELKDRDNLAVLWTWMMSPVKLQLLVLALCLLPSVLLLEGL